MQECMATPGALFQGLLHLSSRHAGVACSFNAVVINLASTDAHHEPMAGRAPALPMRHEVLPVCRFSLMP